MYVRAKAPLRLGLAGGGTDVSPYSDTYGGAVLNISINLFATTTIYKSDSIIKFYSIDLDCEESYSIKELSSINVDGELCLAKGVYKKLLVNYPQIKGIGFILETIVEAPKGSGLGSSSTLVVSILKAFCEFFDIPLGEYDIAHLAYEIERVDMKLSGGKQDQYAAAFGGVNFMEFHANDNVIVNPLKIKSEYLFELENNLLLFYTGKSRLSSKIINQQSENVNSGNIKSIEAMHELKRQAILMKEALLKGNLFEIGEILDYGWQNKKNMAIGISNSSIDEIYEKAKAAGASGGKLSGAGGGGFFVFFCPQNSRYKVKKALEIFDGNVYDFQFFNEGAKAWKVND